MTVYDIVVVGAGAAGLTAAKRAAAGGASTVVIDRMGVGGQISTVEGITNFPGHPEPVAGYDLGVQLMQQAEEAGAEVMLAEAAAVHSADGGFVLSGPDNELQARAIVVASGSTRRLLGIPGEEEFDGRGVSHCASCDGPFFRDKRVVVVGGGDSALDEARVLAESAKDVLVVHDGPKPTAAPAVAAQAAEYDNIRYRPRSTLSAIHGDGRVQSVAVRDLDAGGETQEEVHGVFAYIGLTPNTDWLDGFVELSGAGHIKVDADLATSTPGIYAAGDIREGTRAMLDEAVADGVRAAQGALDHLAATRW